MTIARRSLDVYRRMLRDPWSEPNEMKNQVESPCCGGGSRLEGEVAMDGGAIGLARLLW